MPPNRGQLGVRSLPEPRDAIAFAKASSESFMLSTTQAAPLKWSRSGTAVKSIAAPLEPGRHTDVPQRRLFWPHGQHRLGVGARDSQQRSRSPTGLLASLFPALQRTDGHAQERSKLRLRQARLLPRFDDGRCDYSPLTCLHFTNGLNQVSAKIALAFIFFQFRISERLTLRGHVESPSIVGR